MTANKPKPASNPGIFFTTARSQRLGGPPPTLVAQSGATKVYRCCEPRCKASVRLSASDPLPDGWTIYSGSATASPAYHCPDHRKLTNNDYRRAARRIYEREGVIEIEEFAHVEDADGRPGVWVEGWVWVSDEEASKSDAQEAQGEN